MTSRRNVTSGEKEPWTGEGSGRVAAPVSPPSSTTSDIAPAVPTSVIVKLLGFTVAMIGAPIGTYYLSLNSIFKGNSTFAGAMAAIMANVVLIAYIVVAMKEDQSERIEAQEKKRAKKSQ